MSRRTKTRVDALLATHAVVSTVGGVIGVLFPHFFEWLLIHHGQKLGLRDVSGGNDQKIEHLMMRLYGALILAQAWITHCARKLEEPGFRRALVQAYCVCFGLTTLALLRAQMTEGGGLNAYNWFNIFGFAAATALYGWFAFFEKIHRFEGLGKAIV